MIKYYIVDSATDEKKETTKEDFFTSLIYNLDENVKSGSYTTYEALCSFKFMMSQEQGDIIKKRETSVNGFIYRVEAIA